MARIARSDSGNPWINIVLGIIFVFIGMGIESERFQAYAIIGGIVLVGRGIYQMFSGTKLDPDVMIAPITDVNYESVDLHTSAAWYLFERGLRHRGQSWIAGSMFVFQSSLPKDFAEENMQDYPVQKLLSRLEQDVLSTFNKKVGMEITAVIGQQVTGKDKKNQMIDFGIKVQTDFRPKNAFDKLEKLVTDAFRDVENQLLEELGREIPVTKYVYDPELAIRLEEEQKITTSS